jgi:hypothetical protein
VGFRDESRRARSETAHVTLDELALVGAALQKQASRDFGPIWGIDATADVFPQLEAVPLGYWHVVIRDDSPGDGLPDFSTF